MIWTPRAQDIARVYGILCGMPVVADEGLLQSSLSRPHVTVFGSEPYEDIHQKSAALIDSICRNHALVDGNKRFGWIGVRLTYFRNEGTVWLDGDNAAYDLVMRISGEHLPIVEIARSLASGFRGPRR